MTYKANTLKIDLQDLPSITRAIKISKLAFTANYSIQDRSLHQSFGRDRSEKLVRKIKNTVLASALIMYLEEDFRLI